MQLQELTEMYAPNVKGRISCTVAWNHSYGVEFIGCQCLWKCESDLAHLSLIKERDFSFKYLLSGIVSPLKHDGKEFWSPSQALTSRYLKSQKHELSKQYYAEVDLLTCIVSCTSGVPFGRNATATLSCP